MCRYIGDSQRIQSTKATAELTGSVEADVSKNIYDLAGNCSEWTMEAYSSGRIIRAGGWYATNVLNARAGTAPNQYHPNTGFRIALYIK